MILVFGKMLHWFRFWKFLYKKTCLEFFVWNFYLSLFLKINRFNFFRIKFYKNFIWWENLKNTKTMKNHKNTKICFVLFLSCSDYEVLRMNSLIRNTVRSEWRKIFPTRFKWRVLIGPTHPCHISVTTSSSRRDKH